MMPKPWFASAPLSMAHLCELDTPPAALVALAAGAGLASVGFRLSPAAPGGICYPLRTGAEQREVRDQLAATGIELLYIELISLTGATRPEDHRPMLETGAALGARRLCVAGDSPDLDLVADKLAAICDLAAPLGIVVDLEFMPFRGVRSLADAVTVVRRSGRPNAKILVDALHMVRSATPVSALADLDPALVGTFQICDGPLQSPPAADLATEARTRRLAPGAGELPLRAMLEALPAGTPIGIEVPLPAMQPGVPSARRLGRLVADTCTFLSQG